MGRGVWGDGPEKRLNHNDSNDSVKTNLSASAANKEMISPNIDAIACLAPLVELDIIPNYEMKSDDSRGYTLCGNDPTKSWTQH